MGRILFLLGLVCVAWVLFKSWARKQLNTKSSGYADQNINSNSKPQEEIMSCRHCGTYSPMSEGLVIQGRFYCGLEHAKVAGEKLN